MAKFVNSSDSMSSSLLLWNDTPTQVSIQETYDLKVWPVTNLFNDGPINFNIPPQPKGLLTDLQIITKVKLLQNGQEITTRSKNVSVINNIANSLWGEVSVVTGNRTELCQSMRNAYAYQSFLNQALSSEKNREGYLLYNEGFLMDEGVSKTSAESLRTFWKWDDINKNITLWDDVKSFPGFETLAEGIASKIDNAFQFEYPWDPVFKEAYKVLMAQTMPKYEGLEGDELEIAFQNEMTQYESWVPTQANPAASKRSNLFNRGRSVTLCSKFHCPLLNTTKCLPTNMNLRMSLTKNTDDFLLLCNADAGYSLTIEDCYLNVTYYRVRDEILELIEERLRKDPIPYFISRPEIIVRPVTQASRIVRINDIFANSILPPYAFFMLQRSRDFEGHMLSNPFIMVPYKKFQLYRDGVPIFADPLEVGTIRKIGDRDYQFKDFGEYLRQLYHTLGKDSQGSCLINENNFHLNFMTAISFGADRSSINDRHLNLQEKASTSIEIDLGTETFPEDLILIVYAVFDRQIQIDSNRIVRIIE